MSLILTYEKDRLKCHILCARRDYGNDGIKNRKLDDMKRILIIMLAGALSFSLYGQNAKKFLKAGETFMKSQRYEDAVAHGPLDWEAK